MGPGQNIREYASRNDSANPSAQKAFYRFLRGDCNQAGSSKSDTTQVSKNIIDNNQAARQHEPNDTVQDIVNDEMTAEHHYQQRHVGHTQGAELELVVALFQVDDEDDKPKYVQKIGDELVIGGQKDHHFAPEEHIMKELEKRLTIQIVYGGEEEIPIDKFIQWNVLISGGLRYQLNDLFEHQDAEHYNKGDEWKMARANDQKEEEDHK